MAAGLLKETASQYEQALEDYLSVQDHEPRNVDALRRIAGVYDKLHMTSARLSKPIKRPLSWIRITMVGTTGSAF